MPSSPLARGVLAGKPQGNGGESARARGDEMTRKWRLGGDIDTPVVDALGRVAADSGMAMARIALAWVASLPWGTSDRRCQQAAASA